MCLYTLDRCRYLSLHHSYAALCLYILKFSSLLVSDRRYPLFALAMHLLSSPAWAVVFPVMVVMNILEAGEKCAKYTPFTRRDDANSKYKGCTLQSSSP
jgi:hypothetical protein